jgi:twitching motility protein PilU
MDFKDYLRLMVEKDGSDLFLSTGAPISSKIYGKLVPLSEQPLKKGQPHQIALSLMNEDQRKQFEKKPECNLAIGVQGVGRFRVNIFKQRHETGIVIRAIKTEIPTFASLNLPPILKETIMQKRGLILFVGGTGSGKSTSLASLIDHRNVNSSGHIITIEDPIEFIHKHKKCIVNQREVGVDTDCYEDALENTLRQAPDVILIGEIRTAETMEHAIAFAETGHLCISTLHANNANQAIDRIVNFFPEERHKQLFLDLSLNLRAIISQRLVPTVDGKRAAAVEVLLGTPRVCDLIKNGEADAIKEVMLKSEAQGMQTFDTALYKLYKERKISLEEALRNADSKNNLRLRINLDENPAATASQAAAEKSEPASKAPAASSQSAAPEAQAKESTAPPAPKPPMPALSLEPLQADEPPAEEEDNAMLRFKTNG